MMSSFVDSSSRLHQFGCCSILPRSNGAESRANTHEGLQRGELARARPRQLLRTRRETLQTTPERTERKRRALAVKATRARVAELGAGRFYPTEFAELYHKPLGRWALRQERAERAQS